MTPDREKVIRQHYRPWDVQKIGPVLRVPEPLSLQVVPSLAAVKAHDIPLLEYRYEEGRIDEHPAYRITCEGIVVKQGFL